MRIGDLAKRAGTTMRTIRYYEERGLIAPARRSKGGFRLYEDGELRKLHLIRSLQLLDIPLADVKALFDERQRGRVGAEIAPPIQQVLRQQLAGMERRISQYRAMQESLRETIAILDGCRHCPLQPGPEVCGRCPVITGRRDVPLPMQALIDAA
jgi:DNA-binding transcriptional MerR regulator